MSIDGTWQGYYLQPSLAEGEFPIVAKFRNNGDVLSGSMIDERLTTTQSIHDLLNENPIHSEHGEAWAVFASEYPDANWTTTLPAESELHGTIKGKRIQFTKSYIGNAVTVCEANGLESVSEVFKNPPIEYKGELSPDSLIIQGNWTIYKTTLFGLSKRVVLSGEFKLIKVQS